ncbi:MAG: stage III sporulation protein AB [Christensenellales bacterium]|jgi:stage III sporulation protein AB
MRSARKLYSRCAELTELRAGLRALRTEIAFCKTPLNIAVIRIPAKGALGDFSRELQTIKEPAAAWQKVEGRLLAEEPERQALSRFFSSLGKGNMAAVEREFERIDQTLSAAIKEAEKRAKNGGKLRSTLGVLTGVAAVILMI